MARTNNAETAADDGGPSRPERDLTAGATLLEELRTEARPFFKGRSLSAPFPEPNRFKRGRVILAADPDTQVAFIREGMKLKSHISYSRNDEFYLLVHDLTTDLLARKLPFIDEDISAFAVWIGTQFTAGLGIEVRVLSVIERYAQVHELSPGCRGRLETLWAQFQAGNPGRAEHAAAARIGKLLGTVPFRIDPGEAWSDSALADLDPADRESYRVWSALLAACQKAGSGRPTARWMEEARALVDGVGRDEFKARLLRWFPLVDRPRTDPRESSIGNPSPNDLLEPHHVDLLKGLAWCAGLEADRELARSLGALALSCYRSVPEKGPRLVLLGNSAVWALGTIPGRDGIGQLELLKFKVKQLPIRAQIEKALAAAAAREGLPADDLDELSVQVYGLTEVGRHREVLGEYAVDLSIETGGVELRWSTLDDGKPLGSDPAAAKTKFAARVNELQAQARDAGKMLTAQRDRIDRLFLGRKSWELDAWRERYLDHPLVGVIARRLIWRFAQKGKAASGAWLDGRLVDSTDRPLKGLGAGTTVEMWHPIDRTADEVAAWRDWLERHQVRQPFKQAHREFYVLTDAERATRTYSNRFAAHIVRQHQYHALCAGRGWRDRLRLMVGGEYPPTTRELPGWRLRAEFLVEGLGTDPDRDINSAGTFQYLSTHQVRFHGEGRGLVPLHRVPALVLSEILRDIDLFVSVASVGNDPDWVDGGPYRRHLEYVHEFASGTLSASGATRKAVLERLIPRLSIAARCSFSDRFLLVRGDERSYKIHLGSGHIFMLPDEKYLCIVPKSRAILDESIFLPFEGDETLSIILSKAFLLADDSRIKDPAIRSQIHS